ncbi:DUF4249 domain-containing protein [Bacteroidota bacterium]
MRNSKTIAIIFSLMILLWNCTERIDIEVDSSFTRLVVEGYVTTDTAAHWVRLSTSSDYFYNQTSPLVGGASLSIYDGEQIHLLTESASEPGMYFTEADFHGIPGKTYTLRIRDVDIDGNSEMEEYSGSSILNPVNPVDSIKLRQFSAFDNKGYEVQIYAWDSPRRDWYAFKVHRNDKLITDTLSELWVQNDEFFNGNYTYGITSQFLSMDKPDEILEIGDTVTFEINGITEEYYNYIIEAQSQIYSQIPLFSGPPANIRTNMDNGAIGFFVAYAIHRSFTIATEDIVFASKVK